MSHLARALSRLRLANPYDTVIGRIYDFGIEHERIGRLAGRLVAGADIGPMYESMAAIGKVPDGGTILDVPCGGGVAFRALEPERDVRYLAIDLSGPMLDRARSLAQRRRLGQIEFIQADVESLPVDGESVDLCLCYNSLHCFRDPAAAVAEMARCLKPGGRFVGTMVIRGCGRRWDRRIRLWQLQGTFGPGGTEQDLRRWVHVAGLTVTRLERSGAWALIEARK